MLNRRHRSVLAEIEQHLASEDPALDRTLRGDLGSGRLRRRRHDNVAVGQRPALGGGLRPVTGWQIAVIGSILLVVSMGVGYGTGSMLGLFVAGYGIWRITRYRVDLTDPTRARADRRYPAP